MNIIFLLDSPFPYYTGGRETWLYNVTRYLCQEHQVYILVQAPPSSEGNGSFPYLDSRIHLLQSKDFRNNFLFRHFIHSYIVPLNLEVAALSMRQTLKKLLYSLKGQRCYVISMDTIYTGRIGLWAKRLNPNVVFINSVRGRHADVRGSTYPLLNGYFHKQERKSLSGADQIWSNGWDTQETLQKQGFSSIVMKNGVDTERAKHPLLAPPELLPIKGEYRVLMVGTLQDTKGCRELIQAAGILKRKYGILIGITFFGKGNPEPYNTLAKQEDVDEQVCFAGVHPETVEYASSFQLAVCLGYSLGGGLSMACLESLLSGTPVMASDIPCYRQMITHGKSGWLVPEKDPEATAEGIRWLMDHKEEAQRMGKEAQKHVEEFDWSYIVRDIVKELEEG